MYRISKTLTPVLNPAKPDHGQTGHLTAAHLVRGTESVGLGGKVVKLDFPQIKTLFCPRHC